MATMDVTLPDGSRRTGDALLAPWIERRDQSRKARRPFEGQWMTSQNFAAGRQWVVYQPREHRVIDDPRRRKNGRSMETSDVLTQYLWTAIGKLASDDFRPQLLFNRDDEESELYTQQANLAFSWGWEEEWKGDQALLDLLLTIVVFGTAAVRCRYDRTKGSLLGDVPHVDGKPLLDPEQARTHVAEAKYYGEPIDLRPLREGAVSWEVLSPWNLLPPPGIEHAADFPWHIVVRPVALEQLKDIYGDRAQGVQTEDIEAMSLLGMKEPTNLQAGPALNDAGARLKDHALVYTGYQRPTSEFPKGQRIVWAGDGHLLDLTPQLDYQDQPYGPRPGLTYFRYWQVKQRFWGRGLIEPGIGPQRRRNKRSSQVDEIIDRGLPKIFAEEGSFDADTITGDPNQVVWIKTGAAIPRPDGGVGVGPWMKDDLEQCDTDIEKALGLRAVALGSTPVGVSAFSALSLLTENDAVKLDPIAKTFKLAVADLSRDTFEAMRQWPDGKQLLIAGEDDRLQALVFERSMLPASYMIRPAKGGTLPRSQAAEIQKIADLWNAAVVGGAVAQDPVAWLEWYKQSLDEGKAGELPRMTAMAQQRHKAALENIVMVRTGQVVPVAEYDDHQIHVEEHRDEQLKLSQGQDLGDQQSGQAVQVIEQHVQEHLGQAQASAGGLPGGPQQPPGPGGQQPFIPPAQYENTLQTPRLPRAGNNAGFR